MDQEPETDTSPECEQAMVWPSDWQPIETAPRSTVDARGVLHTVYLLGYCPEESADPQGCIGTIWWEPLMNRGRGQWHSDVSDEGVHPTHWMPLPPAPTAAKIAQESAQ
jgi:hypothetical protein